MVVSTAVVSDSVEVVVAVEVTTCTSESLVDLNSEQDYI